MIEVPAIVKEALKDGRLKKNYKISVLNDDGSVDFVIDNDNLVDESVSIDERLDSGDEIKFGLCEGSSLEFQYFDKPIITGRRVNVQLEIEYGDNAWYPIPLGYFDVYKCSRQASTGILKVTAYNKLMSDYLDAKANNLISETFYGGEAYVNDVLKALLDDYSITKVNRNQIIYLGAAGDGSYTSNQNKRFSFTNVSGDFGPIGPPLNATTSTLFNFAWAFWRATYYDSSNSLFTCQIEVTKDVAELDAIYWNWVCDLLSLMPTNKTLETLEAWNIEMDVDSQGFKGWFYQIVVRIETGRDAYNQPIYEDKCYGNTLYEHGMGDGTFDDLNHLTFENVYRVYLLVPRMIQTVHLPLSSDLPVRTMLMYGNDIQYQYYENNEIHYNTYPTPKMPNGDNIDEYPYQIATSFSVYKVTDIPSIGMVKVDTSELSEVTMRELQSAVYETECQYGQLDRITDLFSGVELNKSRLYPATDLYPNSSLYPDGAAFSSNKSIYSQLWADDGNIRNWRYLIITYKTLDENNQEIEAVLQRTIDENGTDDYNMSDNWLLKNLIWTAADVGDIADAMVAKMQDITWFPFEMWLPGLPYIETGDEIEVSINGNTYPTYVLQRQLKGIQNLQDTYINGTLDIF